MKNILKNKKIFILITIFIFFVIIFVFTQINKTTGDLPREVTKSPLRLCYYQEIEAVENMPYEVYLSLEIKENQTISGIFNKVPSKTDSSFGELSGIIKNTDQEKIEIMSVYNYFSEGSNSKEEKYILLDENSASIKYGDMSQNQDGVFVYKDTKEITYTENVNKIDCEVFDQMEYSKIPDYFELNN